jgi:superfamily II DNA or RNA helicase
MGIKLRQEYQVPFIEAIRSEIKNNPTAHIACNLVGGGGKTIIFSFMTLEAVANGWYVFVFSDRHELITQASGAFSKFKLKHTFINPTAKFPDYDTKATICSSQTFRRRIDKIEWRNLFNRPKTMVIIDEADGQEFSYLFESGLLDNILTLGFSGTFARSGSMRQLGLDYDVIVKGVAPNYLVELGYLVPDRYFAVSEPNLTGVKIDSKTGDYKSQHIYEKFHKKEMYQGMIHNYMTHTPNTKVLSFGANQVHAINMAIEFNKAGIETKFLISGVPKPKKPEVWENEGERVKYEIALESYMMQEQYKHFSGNRKAVVDDFKKGKIKSLTNAGLFTTGFDVPDLETVIINKSTLSLREYLQISWRVVRISPETGKVIGNIIDLGNHAFRESHPFGRCLDDRDYGLWHEPAGKGGGIQPTKECPRFKKDNTGKLGCGRLIAVMYSHCPKCGYRFPTKQEVKDAELKEIIYDGQPEESVLVANMNYLQLSKYRELKGYKMGWIVRELYRRGGRSEAVLGMKELGYKIGYTERLLSYIK